MVLLYSDRARPFLRHYYEPMPSPETRGGNMMFTLMGDWVVRLVSLFAFLLMDLSILPEGFSRSGQISSLIVRP